MLVVSIALLAQHALDSLSERLRVLLGNEVNPLRAHAIVGGDHRSAHVKGFTYGDGIAIVECGA